MTKPWSNLAQVVYKRTYSRHVGDDPTARLEKWPETVERVIAGNVRGHSTVTPHEIERLHYYFMNRKGGPAGRGWWYSGAAAQARLGGTALNSCWFTTSAEWENFVWSQDMLMLGGGVGMSVEHRYTSKLPRVRRGVVIMHRATKDADFIVPDSREGWNDLHYRVLESFFVTGKSFTYSTVCVRGYGEPIKGFGGTASGPVPLVEFITKLCTILLAREGKHIRPIDAADMICADGEMVVSGNVRRSSIIIIGDPWDKEYLRAKRWDLGPIPTQRAKANFSVNCSDIEDLHPSFWETYKAGEPFGIVNVQNIRKYGRMGELKKDSAQGVNPCAEATLEDGEPCNLQEIPLPNLCGTDEFFEIARLMHRWGKRVTMEKYHSAKTAEVVGRNRRVGTGITGCLQSPLFRADILDEAYAIIQAENVSYSKQLGIPESIRTTVVKPGGTTPKMFDVYEGISAGWSHWFIQRVRFTASDPLVQKLSEAGHHIEPEVRFDGSVDGRTLVVDFYIDSGEGAPVSDGDWDTWKQLDTVLMAQRHWSDQSVSVTVTYRREEIPQIKEWLGQHLNEVKSISFLCHSDHGFKQAPKEAITKAEYDRLASKVRPIDVDDVDSDGTIAGVECEGGSCPIK